MAEQQRAVSNAVRLTASIIIWIVAAFYLYGTVVHVLNILSYSGFDWAAAPLKWQVLDIAYLILDVLVVAGLVLGWKVGFGAFYLAAISQILLYTLFRDWIVEVPREFTVTEAQRGYLTTLVIFHFVTLALVTFALWARQRSN